MIPGLPEVKCKTCEVGALRKIRKYRMSGIVVLIGYILLIPSVIGVLFSALGFIRMVTLVPAAVTRPISIGQSSAEVRKVLGEPTEVFDGNAKSEFFWYYGPKTRQTSYSFRDDKLAQIYSPSDRSQTTTTTTAASTIASGIFIFFGVVSLVGGLLGWLLVMKKDILQCSHCGAAVAAS